MMAVPLVAAGRTRRWPFRRLRDQILLDEFDGEGAVLQRFEKAGAGRAIAFPLGIDNGVLQVRFGAGGQLVAGATDGNHHVVERAGACVAVAALQNRQSVG